MIKGVNLKEEEIIKQILEPFSKDYDFFYYGSRVKGNFSAVSDLDLLVKSKNNEEISYKMKEFLKTTFDESDLPYIVNFTDYMAINQDFYDCIKKDLVFVFE